MRLDRVAPARGNVERLSVRDLLVAERADAVLFLPRT